VNVQDDLLSIVLGSLRVSTVQLARLELGAPWGGAVEPVADVVLHYLAEGTAWLRDESGPRQLVAGDFVLIARGHRHALCDAAETVPLPAGAWNKERTDAPVVRRRLGGKGRPTCVLLCAALDITGAGRRFFLEAFPGIVHLRGSGEREAIPGLSAVLDALRAEVRETRPASRLMLARYAELLVLHALRGTPLFASMKPGLSRALAALHRRPERGWTLAALAREAGMSRSVFAMAFADAVGEPPMRHLARWRLALARELIESGDPASLEELAGRVGYAHHAAFTSAFRREFGAAPSSFRPKLG
jgi:AraC family transcriptional activator of mtrCDE